MSEREIAGLTEEEIAVINKLGEAWNLFSKLDAIHPSDDPGFIFAIHSAQNIVLARPALRVLNAVDIESKLGTVKT